MFDVDGVLVDLMGPTLRKLSTKFKERAPSLGQIDKYDLSKCLDAEMFEDVTKRIWADPYLWRHLPPRAGAVHAVEELRSMGVHVIACTAPVKGTGFDFEGVRREMLADHFGIDGHDVLFCPARHKHRVSADVFVEDRDETLSAWIASNPNGLAILMSQPWNEGILTGVRVPGFGGLFWCSIASVVRP